MKLNRRGFLRTTLPSTAFLSFTPCIPRFIANAAMAAEASGAARDTVLVAIQLSGGNDGLNTVVPYAEDAFAQARNTLRWTAAQVHKINEQLGLHPRMQAFYRLFQEGTLTVVQGVGYPNSDRNHPSAMRIWHTAATRLPGPQCGWMGRAADHLWKPAESNVPAMFVGAIPQPFAMNAENFIVPSIRSPRDLVCPIPRTIKGVSDSTAHAWSDSLRQSMAQVNANSRRIELVLQSSEGAGKYPQYQLADDLRTIAQLIRVDIGTRIFLAELGGGGIGGFDNHAGQLGNHCSLLQQLSESVAAFADDLQRDRLLDRVVLMTFSEFGRTLHENGRRGTGHGAAAPVFLVGGRTRGGLIGEHPSLTDLDNDGLKHQTDFRQLYATLLDNWLGIDSRSVLNTDQQPLPLLT
jgi:uncharacterized protein (DUF1501 family)